MKYLQIHVDVLKRRNNFIGITFFCVLLFFSGIINVEAQTNYSIESDSSSYTNTTITISWSAPANRTTRSGWIGIYEPTDADTGYYRWAYINSAANSGSVTFTNIAPGTYEARFFSGSGYALEAKSTTFTVVVNDGTPDPDPDPDPDPNPNPDPESGEYSLASSQSSYAGTAVTISWSAPSSRTTRAGWIGVFQPTASDSGYYRWAYINSSLNTDTVTFRGIAPGTYEARFFSGSGYSLEATSATFTVSGSTPDPNPNPDSDLENGGYLISSEQASYTGTTVSISWSAPSGRGVRSGWVGIYEPNDSDSGYYKWQYINGSLNSGTLTFSGIAPGTYEARFFSGSGYALEAKSATFSVVVNDGTPDPDPDPDPNPNPDPDPVGGEYGVSSTEVSYTNTTITISWSAPTNRTTRSGWIGIYKPTDADTGYYRWAYINSAANSGSVTFTNIAPGTYEARFFSGSGYALEAKSATFSVVVNDGTPDPNPNPNPNPDPDPVGGEYGVSVSANSITVGGSVVVTFTTPTSGNFNRDWIGLYKVGDNNQSYQAWKYISAGTAQSLTFVMSTVGQYEFRYFKNDSYTVVATSPTLTVVGAVVQCPISNLETIINYPPQNGPIVAFGDSLTAGVGASAGQDYVSELERLADVSIINAGVSGDTTRMALARLQEDVLSQSPSTVIVWLGGNDALVRYYDRVVRGLESPTFISLLNAVLNRLGSMVTSAPLISEDESFANLETIVRTIQADGAVVILVGFSGEPFDSDLETRFAEVAEQTGALYVPNALSGVIGRPDRMSDLIHPNDTGYDIVAGRIYQRFSCVQ